MATLDLKVQFGDVLQKTKESPTDCQDAYDANPQLGRFAIADGVGSTFYPKQWSKALVQHFCYDSNDSNKNIFSTQDWKNWLDPIQKKWDIEIQKIIPRASGARLTRLKNDYQNGKPAASTFVGLEIGDGTSEIPLRLLIIGDSCFFHFSSNLSFTSFPMSSSAEFDNYPECFFSKSGMNKFTPKFFSRKVKLGDFLILATDAFSKWMLTYYETKSDRWQEILKQILSLRTYDEFQKLVTDARYSGEIAMEDDDVTLLVLRVVEGDRSKISGSNLFPQKEIINKLPVQISSKSPVPAKTQPTNQLPEKRQRKSYLGDALSILALLISISSLIISLFVLSKFDNREVSIEITPTLIQPTLFTIPTDVTLIVTETLMPTAEPPLVLPVSSVIYADTDRNSQQIILAKELIISVYSRVERIDGEWIRFSNNFWVKNQEGMVQQDNILIIQTEVPLFLNFDGNELIGNLVLSQKQYTILETLVDNAGSQWFKIEFIGYHLLP